MIKTEKALAKIKENDPNLNKEATFNSLIKFYTYEDVYWEINQNLVRGNYNKIRYYLFAFLKLNESVCKL